jgi:hypothetical protein
MYEDFQRKKSSCRVDNLGGKKELILVYEIRTDALQSPGTAKKVYWTFVRFSLLHPEAWQIRRGHLSIDTNGGQLPRL